MTPPPLDPGPEKPPEEVTPPPVDPGPEKPPEKVTPPPVDPGPEKPPEKVTPPPVDPGPEKPPEKVTPPPVDPGPEKPPEKTTVVDVGRGALALIDRWLTSESVADRDRGVRDLAMAAQREPKLRAEAVDRLLRLGLSDPEGKVRATVAGALLELQWPRDAELEKAIGGGEGAWRLLDELFARADDRVGARLVASLAGLVRADAAQAERVLSHLGAIGRRVRRPAVRRAVVGTAEGLLDHKDAPVASAAALALAQASGADRALAATAADRLLRLATTRREAGVADAAVRGLAALEWSPTGAAERQRLVAIGAPALALVDGMLAHRDPDTRGAGVRLASAIGARHAEAREAVAQRHLRVASSERDAAVAQLAVAGLRALGWPRTDADWADLVRRGAGALRLIHGLLGDKDAAVRARAAASLGEIGAADRRARSYAVQRLLHQARAERVPAVRDAAFAGLSRLGWPASDADWQEVKRLGSGALCFLVQRARGKDAAQRARALAMGRQLGDSLLAGAERAGDKAAVLHGLELQWDMARAERTAAIRARVAEGRLEDASALFGEALTKCEETEKRVHALVIETGAWPQAGVADKWGELLACLEHGDLAALRRAWPLTIGNWTGTLRQRSKEAGAWRAAYHRAVKAGDRAAAIRELDAYLKANPQSFYARIAWKWADALRRRAATPKP